MKLTDVMPSEKWLEFAKSIYSKFGLNGAIYNKEGFLVHPRTPWANELCPIINGNKDSHFICASAQQNLSAMAKEQKKPIIGECDAGLIKIDVPIFVGNEFIGTAGGCGHLSEEGEVETFFISKMLNIEEEKVKELLTTVKKMSQNELDEVVKYVENELEKILSNFKNR